MRRSRVGEEQVVAILREQESGVSTAGRVSTADVRRRHGIRSATFHKWKAGFGGMEVSEARRLKALEDENARLKRLLAEAMLDDDMLRDVAAGMVTPDAKRAAVAHLCEVHEVSRRRACAALAVDRSSIRYAGRRGDDAELRAKIREIAAERRRFGYRRIHVLLKRQGVVLNHKTLRRLYAEEKLQVKRRGGRKRALGTRRPLVVPDGPNRRWSLDARHCRSNQWRDMARCRTPSPTAAGFASSPSSTTSPGNASRSPSASDRWRLDGSRPDTSISGARAAHEPDAFAESFNGRLRDELLNETPFRSLNHARSLLEASRRHYNSVRPHAALGWLPPAPEVSVTLPTVWPHPGPSIAIAASATVH